MLYRFQSAATADVILLSETAQRILRLWNKPPEGPGILLLDQMPQARAALVQEAEREAHEREQARASAVSQGQTPVPSKSIPFATRIHPLLQVLDTCMKEEADLMW
jgi:formate dehydrogenase maturation protein FdhE